MQRHRVAHFYNRLLCREISARELSFSMLDLLRGRLFFIFCDGLANSHLSHAEK
jgi:hypothetical protein